VLPLIGTDFGKGAVRWLRLPGGMSVQPSEFLKPCFVAAAHGSWPPAKRSAARPAAPIRRRWRR
jgi:cell division protein FtsW (lipid II flippase)